MNGRLLHSTVITFACNTHSVCYVYAQTSRTSKWASHQSNGIAAFCTCLVHEIVNGAMVLFPAGTFWYKETNCDCIQEILDLGLKLRINETWIPLIYSSTPFTMTSWPWLYYKLKECQMESKSWFIKYLWSAVTYKTKQVFQMLCSCLR